MFRTWVQPLLLISAVALLAAADPPWNAKPAAQWTEEDARQVLTESAWVKVVNAGVVRRLTEDELRESGQMGQHHGVGYDGVDPKYDGPKLPADLITGGNARSTRSLPRAITLHLRWESALPVRVAEFKTREVGAFTLEGDGYQIAVYGIPGTGFKGDPQQLGAPLTKEAMLKRDGKRDVRASRCEVFQRADDLVVTYLFPLSAEIVKSDMRVAFEAHIGRIVVMQSFDLAKMKFLGKLEL